MNFDYRKNFLYFYGLLLRSYKDYSSRALSGFGLKPIEIEILKFLINNGDQFNKARDIERYKGVSKALVSQGVKSLVDRGLLRTQVNREDRRVSDLFITEAAQDIVARLKEANEDFRQMAFQDVSPEDLEALARINQTVMQNLLDFKD